ncbi:MAG TPA: universal stress protein [Thermoanaerobaculia bacterium]|nr:universal stress protein [Thermoanaerobaculia bacterium]
MNTHRILVPTDLTDFGAAALRHAAVLRDPLDAHLTVLYADEPSWVLGMPDLPVASYQRTAADKEQLARTVRAHVEKYVPPPLPEIRIAETFATQAILEAAEAVDASLIVMGTHGRRGWKRLMLGSIAEHVLRQTERPVMTVGPAPQFDDGPRYRTVLCPVNFSRVGLDALREAGAMAARLDCDLVVLYVVEKPDSPPSEELDREFAAWIDPQLRGRCRYRQIVAAGNAADRVLEIAEQIDADLLVIGAQRKPFRDAAIIGSTSERVVRFATCPVLTVVRPLETVATGIHAA